MRIKQIPKILFVMVSLIFVLASCNNSSMHGNVSETTLPDTTASTVMKKIPVGYEYIKDGEKPYIRLIYEEREVSQSSLTVFYSATLNFPSVEQFARTVSEGRLTRNQLVHIDEVFYKDEKGIPCCDFDSLYVPLYPDDLTMGEVHWYGRIYSVRLESDHDFSVHFRHLTEEEYLQKLKEEQDRIFNNEAVTEYSTEKIDDRNATVITHRIGSQQQQEVWYTLETGNTTLQVIERYYMDSYLEAPPKTVFCYGIYEGIYFTVNMNLPPERPSVEWLSEFGAAPYVYEK